MDRKALNKKTRKKKSSDSSDNSIHVRVNSRPSETPIGHDEDCCFLNESINPTTTDQCDVNGPLSDAYTAEGMRQRGWCNNDGTPWTEICPRDEAALLKKGVVSRDCQRASYSASDNCKAEKRLDDELSGLVLTNVIDKMGRPNSKFFELRRIMDSKKMKSGPITKKELETRGFADSLGKVHFGAELTAALNDYFSHLKIEKPQESAMEITLKSHSSLLVAKPSIADNQIETGKSTSCARLTSKLSSKNETITRRGDSGSLQMDVGTAEDRGILSYSVTGDGRTYELQTAKQNVVLEFAKKHSCLVFHST
ncbi:hypothetical protein M3Y96_00336000 [Aphelenchoides besseyi]|nr:hypothetical protein M3Y96_00336000 [Aphelenchoides besseyi]